MNKQGKNGIEYCDLTWNAISGCSNTACPWCYARKIYHRFGKSFEPTFYPGKLLEPAQVKKPSIIFAGSVTDFWDKGVRQGWRDRVFRIMQETPQHTYLILTKQPHFITKEDEMPENAYLGVSYTGPADRWRIKALLGAFEASRAFVSYEPMIGEPDGYFYLTRWIIMGRMTGPNAKDFQPKKEWIEKVIEQGKRQMTAVFMKSNLKNIWDGKLIQQFPPEFKRG